MVCRPLLAAASLAALLTACAGDDAGRETSADSATTTATTGSTSGASTDTSGDSDSDSDSTSTTDASGSATDSASGSTTEPDTSSTSETGETTGDETTGGGFPGANCAPIPDCDAVPPPKLDNDPTPTDNNHRGRDMFYVDGEDQWVLAKFADGGVLDLDYHGDTVRIFLNRGCAGEWEELGTAIASDDGDNPTVEGVEDTGGRIYFKIPEDKKLAPGRHRVHMIVETDKSAADQYIDVVPMGAPIFVSDVDGTLTTSENEEFFDLLLGDIPDANAFAASAFTLLESKGYWPMYMTARPEFLYKRTREFVDLHGFPHGVIHTTLSKSGALGGEAAAYKTGELDMLAAKGLKPVYAFGNKESDAEAYENGDIQPLENRVFFQFNDAVYGGRTINSYGELLDEFDALPDLCE
ncbi:MAG: hypothetical protein R3A79_00640 [Nannocystaceae bacterium]